MFRSTVSALVFMGSVYAIISGCAAAPAAYRGIFTTEERRIWVVRETLAGNRGQQVFRCVDTNEGGGAPSPVCAQAQGLEQQ